VAKAYGLPKSTEQEAQEKATIMEACLKDCVAVPLEIMELVAKAIDLHQDFAVKGAAIAISDVGCGVICCKAALQAASLNVFINTKAMKDREYAAAINNQANALLEKYLPAADAIFASVAGRLV
jgi:formiminotetrahydrofolate cyclodeaminase